MKETLNVQGNSGEEVIVAKDKIYIHTNIARDEENPNLYTYNEYQFDIGEKAKEMVNGLVNPRDTDIAGLMNDIEELCNEIIG